jgi:hypothetical protein
VNFNGTLAGSVQTCMPNDTTLAINQDFNNLPSSIDSSSSSLLHIDGSRYVYRLDMSNDDDFPSIEFDNKY